MKRFKTSEISREEFLKLNEDNLMFITNPGRMGDEDGSTFIIKEKNKFIIYRVSGWMSRRKVDISLNDLRKQFPKWNDTWKNSNKKGYKSKYKYLYMGFGNGLSIDKTIYNEFEPYLNNLVEKYLKDKNDEGLKYSTIYNVWEQAFMNMVNK